MNAAIAIALRMYGSLQVPTETAELLQAPLVQKLKCLRSLLRVQVRVDRTLNLRNFPATADLSHGYSPSFIRASRTLGWLALAFGTTWICVCTTGPGSTGMPEIHQQQAVTSKRIACMCISYSELHSQRDSPACSGSCYAVSSGGGGACLRLQAADSAAGGPSGGS